MNPCQNFQSTTYLSLTILLFLKAHIFNQSALCAIKKKGILFFLNKKNVTSVGSMMISVPLNFKPHCKKKLDLRSLKTKHLVGKL